MTKTKPKTTDSELYEILCEIVDHVYFELTDAYGDVKRKRTPNFDTDKATQQIQALITRAVLQARIEENQTYLNRINNYKPKTWEPSFGNASGAIENAGWKQAFESRIKKLKTKILKAKIKKL